MTKPGTLLATVIMVVVSIAHLLRLLFGVRVTVADDVIPMWVSGVGFVVAGAIAWMLWREGRR